MVNEFADTVEATRLDDWNAKVVEVETATVKLSEKIGDAEVHVEACLLCKTCYCKFGRLEQIGGLGELVRLVCSPA